MMLHHLSCVLEDVFVSDYLLITNVIWNHEHFTGVQSVQCSNVSG